MIDKFHEVHFCCNKDEHVNILNIYHSIEIISNGNELYAKNGGGDFSLYLGNSYLCLDFDTESKRIGNFGGVVKLSDITLEHIIFPNQIIDGILCVEEAGNFAHGGNWRFKFMEKYVYDSMQSLFLMGAYVANEPWFRFLKNAYCQLDDFGNLMCLLISDVSLAV